MARKRRRSLHRSQRGAWSRPDIPPEVARASLRDKNTQSLREAPAISGGELGRARGDGVQVPAQRIHATLELDVDDQQDHEVRSKLHAKHDRDNQRIWEPEPELMSETLTSRVE